MNPDEHTITQKMLAVGNGHTLYTQEWGNPKAETTFIFLHGGPGSGCDDGHKAFFDATKHRVIFFDQRGSGNSTPKGKLEHNTTQTCVDDITAIADHYKVSRFVLIGGSWGACLALAYGLQQPKRVKAMVLRGIFTGAQDEIDFIDKGQFRAFFPEVWETFVESAPPEYQDNPASYHSKRALGTNAKAAKASTYAYNRMEGAIIKLDDRAKPETLDEFEPHGSRIEIHFLVNHCFMPDMYIVNNAAELTMPIHLVQGRYDAVCPPMGAYRLHKALPNSTLTWTIAGHSGNDRANFDVVKALIATIA